MDPLFVILTEKYGYKNNWVRYHLLCLFKIHFNSQMFSSTDAYGFLAHTRPRVNGWKVGMYTQHI